MRVALKGLSPENAETGWAEAVDNVAGNILGRAFGERPRAPRGPRPVRASHCDVVVTSEIHALAAKRALRPESSLNSECQEIGAWKSEASIVAVKSGNADGAKGRRFGITRRRTMDRTPSRTAP
jgi:hypothetical protein